MPTLIVFTSISLDGYFTDTNNDIGWAHTTDAEWTALKKTRSLTNGNLVLWYEPAR